MLHLVTEWFSKESGGNVILSGCEFFKLLQRRRTPLNSLVRTG